MKPDPDITILTDIFSKEEIESLYETVKANDPIIDKDLGRVRVCLLLDTVKEEILKKFRNVIKEVTDKPYKQHFNILTIFKLFMGSPMDLLVGVKDKTNIGICGIDLKT